MRESSCRFRAKSSSLFLAELGQRILNEILDSSRSSAEQNWHEKKICFEISYKKCSEIFPKFGGPICRPKNFPQFSRQFSQPEVPAKTKKISLTSFCRVRRDKYGEGVANTMLVALRTWAFFCSLRFSGGGSQKGGFWKRGSRQEAS